MRSLPTERWRSSTVVGRDPLSDLAVMRADREVP